MEHNKAMHKYTEENSRWIFQKKCDRFFQKNSPNHLPPSRGGGPLPPEFSQLPCGGKDALGCPGGG